jgi:hypothetical protein
MPPVGTGTAAEASSGRGYAVQVASEPSAADAHAVFRTLQAKFPNQLGGREPIVAVLICSFVITIMYRANQQLRD